MAGIKHLVIGGGGPTGLILFGLLSRLAQENYWSPDEIQTIYATSFGAIIAVCISLGYNWEDLEDYLVKRPWNKLVDFNLRSCVNAIYSKGLISGDFCRQALIPLLTAKDYEEDITLQQFYKATGKEIHMYAVDANQDPLTTVDISYKSHPEMKIWEAVTISASVPILFPPCLYEGQCLIDGGILNNYPARSFLNDWPEEAANALGVKLKFEAAETSEGIDEETTIFEFMGVCVKKLIRMVYPDHATLPLQIECSSPNRNISDWLNILGMSEARQSLIDDGKNYADRHLLQQREGATSEK